MTFRVTVTYRGTDEQVHEGLSDQQVDSAAYAFTSDMVHLKGQGVTKLVIEIEEAKS